MTKAEEQYGDIIHMERPVDEDVFRRHPQMPLQKRAKIFSPFAALRGYSEQLRREEEKLLRETRREFSEEEGAAMTEKLRALHKGDTVTVLRFEPDPPDGALGFYRPVRGVVSAVDFPFRRLRIRPEAPELPISREISIAFEDIGALTAE